MGGSGSEKAVRLINNFQDISFGEIALIVLGTWLAITGAQRIIPYLADRGPSQARLYIMGAVPIIRLILMVTAILWIFPLIFNVTFQNFLVVAGAASVAIGFAFKDYVSSLIAGIVAVVERPYRPGDWVRIGDDYGEVVSVGLRAVRLKTADDNIVTVPHLRLWSDNISNANDGAPTLQCAADFYVAPGHDAARLRAELQEVALTSAYLSYVHPVIVVLRETPFGTHYKLRAYPFDFRDQFQFVSDLTVRGKQAIADVGAVQVASAVATTEAGAAPW